jgi:hypothetical protein
LCLRGESFWVIGSASCGFRVSVRKENDILKENLSLCSM